VEEAWRRLAEGAGDGAGGRLVAAEQPAAANIDSATTVTKTGRNALTRRWRSMWHRSPRPDHP